MNHNLVDAKLAVDGLTTAALQSGNYPFSLPVGLICFHLHLHIRMGKASFRVSISVAQPARGAAIPI